GLSCSWSCSEHGIRKTQVLTHSTTERPEGADFRFGPEAGSCAAANNCLLDGLVGAGLATLQATLSGGCRCWVILDVPRRDLNDMDLLARLRIPPGRVVERVNDLEAFVPPCKLVRTGERFHEPAVLFSLL